MSVPPAVAEVLTALFGHVPSEVLPDTTEFTWRVPAAGVVHVHTAGDVWTLRDGAAWRFRPAGAGMVELTAWRDRHQVGKATVPEDFDPAQGAPWS